MNNVAVIDKKNKPKNSLIEFYRFLFAMWVVWYHGYFVFKNQYFNSGYIAVEFFFILSGFYLIKGIEKYNQKPFLNGLFEFLFKRIKSLGLPFAVGIIFAFWFMILEGQITLLGFLWYIPFMLVAFAIIYLVKRLIKKQSIFILILALFIVISYLILYIPILEGFGFCRALGGICIGVLVSYIPKPTLKFKKFNFNYLITLVIFLATLTLAFLPKPNMIPEYFLVFLLIPLLIYFTNTLNINNKFLNFLGSLSFGLYAYQCIVRVIEYCYMPKQYILFITLICLVFLDKVIHQIIKHYKNAKTPN